MKTERMAGLVFGFYLIALSATPALALVSATGGNATNDIGGYRIHIFTNSAISSNFVVIIGGEIEVLVVGGGGGGGGCIGGGGGGGGLIFSNALLLFTGSNYPVTVGAGGAGGISGARGSMGSNSAFDTLIAYGGGGGGGWDNAVGLGGGSGGGGANSQAGGGCTNGQGNTGGSSTSNGGGGGGGSATAGTNGTASLGGQGGAGLAFDVSGVLTNYAGGGGAGARNGSATAGGGGLGGGGNGATTGTGSNGLANTGGGGGGGAYDGTYRAGGAGGSGIVIVRYRGALRVSAEAATGISTGSATLNGTVLSAGNEDNPDVYFCWGYADAGTNSGTSVWANVAYLGANWGSQQSFNTNLTGLYSGSTYVYRCYVTNLTGEDWSDEARSFTTIYLPVVTNLGAAADRTQAALRGEILDTGGEAPAVWIFYWEDGSATTNVQDMGLQSGTFATNWTGLSQGVTYGYQILASNQAGSVWSETRTFQLQSAGAQWYVSLSGDGTVGGSWDTAFTNLHSAFAAAAPSDTIYVAQGTFWMTNEIAWTNSDLTVLGGYEGIGAPGAWDAAAWPTVIARTSGSTRLINIVGVTNAVLGRATIRDGYAQTLGGGMRIGDSSNILIFGCTFYNNAAYNASPSYGGGIFITNSCGTVSNCAFRANYTRVQETWSSTFETRGSGVHLSGGQFTFLDCVVRGNFALDSSGYNPIAYARGIGVWADGAHTFRNCLIAGNYHYNLIEPTGGAEGGGMWAQNGVTLENCTFLCNQSEGVRRNAGTVTIRDSILWENGDDIYGSVALVNSCIQDGDSNSVNGCTNADPSFVRGVYLAPTSILIDAGSTTAEAAGMAGHTTQTNGALDTGAVDIGFHQTGAPAFTGSDIYVSTGGSDTNDGASAATPLRTITRALTVSIGGETIHVAAGTYNLAGGEIFPLAPQTYGVTLAGADAATTIADADGVADSSVLDARCINGPLRLQDLSLVNGKQLHLGGGAHLLNSAVAFERCIVANNRTGNSDNWGRARGAGILALSCNLVVSNSIIRGNYYSTTPFYGWGGGLYLSGGNSHIVRSVIVSNTASGWYNPSDGGGFYINAGSHSIENCLIATNTAGYGGGLRVAGGTVVVRNVTVANCAAQGVNYSGGTLSISNSILWGSADDVVGTPAMFYSTAGDGYNNGINGCNATNPLFADAVYFHPMSTFGQYEGGFFDGGSWGIGASLSPAVDTCDPVAPPFYELSPNGAIINRGAYGNTPVAAFSHAIAATNLAPTSIGPMWATLNGELLHVGSSNVQVWIYWGQSDGQDVAGDWDTNTYVGLLTAPGQFAASVTGLVSGPTYYYAALVSNSAGAAMWAQPSTSFVATLSPPQVANRGVVNEFGPTVTLKGEVENTGGDAPHVYICWGVLEGGQSTGSWENVIDMGIQGGVFSSDIATVEGSNYFYTCFAENVAGANWAAPSLPFGHYVFRYVDPAATGGGNGYNWSNAYPSLVTALAECSNSRTNVIYLRGGIHSGFLPFELTNSHVSVRGGFEGVGAPGALDPSMWPTVVSNSSSAQRVWNLVGASDLALEDMIMTGGRPAGGAAGLYINSVTGLIVRRCTISGNVTGAGGNGGALYVINSTNVVFDAASFVDNVSRSDGGGAYLQNSAIAMTNCLFRGNRINGGDSVTVRGMAFLVNGGTTLLRDCIIERNAGVPGYSGAACGAYASYAGIHLVKNCLIRYNEASYGDGAVVYGGTVTFDNCTLFRNRGQGLYQSGGFALVTNSIVWANGDDIAGAVTLAFSAVQDGDGAGTNGCFALHPRFDYLHGLYLSPTSPCVNTGAVTAAAAGLADYTTQVDGTPDDDLVDLGYHYRQGSDMANAPFADLYVSPVGNDTNAGTNATSPLRSLSRALTLANGGNRIHVDAGAYSTNYGEVFPLQLTNIQGIAIVGTQYTATVIDASGAVQRVATIDNACDITIAGLTLANGRESKYDATAYGGGIFAAYAEDLTFADCLFVNNWADGQHWGSGSGGALCLIGGTCVTRDCLFLGNRVTSAGVGGGAVYSENCAWSLLRCAVVSNGVYRAHPPGSTLYGGAFYINGGIAGLTNCLVARNACSENADGIFFNGAMAMVRNATVADNDGYGLWQSGGGVTVVDSIAWGNGDDFYGFATNAEGILTNVTYTDIEDADNPATNGCLSLGPLFVDTNYYHLVSRGGHYIDGYFSGGAWASLPVSSPLIDAGDPASDKNNEPAPNGGRVNMGAYGNSPVASRVVRVGIVLHIR